MGNFTATGTSTTRKNSKKGHVTNRNKIILKYSVAETKWDQVIGEHCNDLISKSLKGELISECNSLRLFKSKLNYRNMDLTDLDATCRIQIQDLIEPHNPSKAQLLPPTTVPLPPIPSWIPTVFRLNTRSHLYEIESEINDLPRCQYPELYHIVQLIFNQMVPSIHRCLNVYPVMQRLRAGATEKDQCSSLNKKMKKKEKKSRRKVSDEYKVIIKMTDYQFMDETLSHYVGGTYHSEGSADKEFIKAVALYHFDVSRNIEGGGLSFQDPKYSDFGGTYDANIDVRNNECVCFTNMQFRHKLQSMNINGNSGEASYDKKNKKIFGSRKVLGFFVVDPEKAELVPSSLDSDVIVNVQFKAGYVIKHWYRLAMEGAIVKDILRVIESFTFGDAKFIKSKVDEGRRQRSENEALVRNTHNIAYQEKITKMSAAIDQIYYSI